MGWEFATVEGTVIATLDTAEEIAAGLDSVEVWTADPLDPGATSAS